MCNDLRRQRIAQMCGGLAHRSTDMQRNGKAKPCIASEKHGKAQRRQSKAAPRGAEAKRGRATLRLDLSREEGRACERERIQERPAAWVRRGLPGRGPGPAAEPQGPGAVPAAAEPAGGLAVHHLGPGHRGGHRQGPDPQRPQRAAGCRVPGQGAAARRRRQIRREYFRPPGGGTVVGKPDNGGGQKCTVVGKTDNGKTDNGKTVNGKPDATK